MAGPWEYIATYIDYIFVFNKDPMSIINTVKQTYELKDVGDPKYYLGSDHLSTEEQSDDKMKVKIKHMKELKNITTEGVKGISYVGHDEIG